MDRLLWVILGAIIGVLVIGLLLYFFMPQKQSKASLKKEKNITMEEILSLLNTADDVAGIERTIALFFNNFENLLPEKRERLELFSMLVRHKKTNSKIILSTEKELKKLNPEDAKELESVLKKGLDSR
ncbi:MAG: hypothetical protein ACTTJS_00085 [Wolinella sp.]